ncbi:hypothetical protein [Streptomyces sp. NPDC054849]
MKTHYNYVENQYTWYAKCSGRSADNWRVTVTFEYLTSPGVYQNYTLPWKKMGTDHEGASANARVVSAYGWKFK